MHAWPGQEPLGNWALVLGATRYELRGLLVQGPAGAARVVSVSRDGLGYEVGEWSGLPADTCLQPLPNHPQPSTLQTFVASTLLGSTRCGLVPLKAQNTAEQPCVAQWAILKLVEHFGCRWRDPERRGDRVRADTTEPAFPGAPTLFRQIPISTLTGEPPAITAVEPPFHQRPDAADFDLDPALLWQPRDYPELQVRALLPGDIPGALDLMRQEPAAFDTHDLEQAEQEMRLASRADLLAAPIPTHSGQRYARTEYWVMTTKDGPLETVRGLVGTIQFYGAEGQYWFAYLCHFGAILTEVLLRKGRELGFRTALVWTTPDNLEAVRWYRTRAGFVDSATRPLEIAPDQVALAFEHPVLPAPRH